MKARVDLTNFSVVGKARQLRQGQFLKTEAAGHFIRFVVREGPLPAQHEESAHHHQGSQRRNKTSQLAGFQSHQNDTVAPRRTESAVAEVLTSVPRIGPVVGVMIGPSIEFSKK